MNFRRIETRNRWFRRLHLRQVQVYGRENAALLNPRSKNYKVSPTLCSSAMFEARTLLTGKPLITTTC